VKSAKTLKSDPSLTALTNEHFGNVTTAGRAQTAHLATRRLLADRLNCIAAGINCLAVGLVRRDGRSAAMNWYHSNTH
jgi:hypothetical protein